MSAATDFNGKALTINHDASYVGVWRSGDGFLVGLTPGEARTAALRLIEHAEFCERLAASIPAPVRSNKETDA